MKIFKNLKMKMRTSIFGTTFAVTTVDILRSIWSRAHIPVAVMFVVSVSLVSVPRGTWFEFVVAFSDNRTIAERVPTCFFV